MNNEIYLELQDTQYDDSFIDHDREIVRAIVVDDAGAFYFVRVERDDDFGKATLIETAGGGVESGEELVDALRRELQEELGVQVDVLAKLGIVSDFYNLVHRHNINHYFLCKITDHGEKNLTQAEIEDFHLTTLIYSYEEAVAEYERRAHTKLGALIAARELPILHHAKKVLEQKSK